jgi:hypothetical protein
VLPVVRAVAPVLFAQPVAKQNANIVRLPFASGIKHLRSMMYFSVQPFGAGQ